MAVSNGTPNNARALLDQNYIASAALPNAANTVNTSGLDLVQATPYPTTDRIDVQIVTTGGNGANSKNINFRLMGSTDNSSFTNIATFANPLLQTVDNSGAGYNNANIIVKLPPSCPRYIRATALGEANGGDASNGSFVVQLLF